jgi:hypothetical protein
MAAPPGHPAPKRPRIGRKLAHNLSGKCAKKETKSHCLPTAQFDSLDLYHATSGGEAAMARERRKKLVPA